MCNFLQRLEAIEATQNGNPGSVLMRTDYLPPEPRFQGQVGWMLGIGELDSPKLKFYGLSVEEVLQEAESMFGISVSQNQGMVLVNGGHIAFNRHGFSIYKNQIWLCLDNRFQNRYATVVGFETNRVVLHECDLQGNVIDDRKIKISPEFMHEHSKGWKFVK